jgi:acetyltransferase-like isoleucine patch superfamily enzyme
MSLEKILVKIRRQETPLYSMIYRIAKSRNIIRFPMPRFISNFLYYERLLRRTVFKRISSKIYYEPMFRSRCERVGKGFQLINSIQGIPVIIGDLKIWIGDNVIMNDIATFCGLKIIDEPRLIIGDNTRVSDRVSIFVGKEVRIGKNCIISSALILDNASHPTDAVSRRNNESVRLDEIEPVIIEDDAWLARGSMVMKGVRVGRGAIVAAGAVVTQNVESYTIVAGNPAKKVAEVPRR